MLAFFTIGFSFFRGGLTVEEALQIAMIYSDDLDMDTIYTGSPDFTLLTDNE